jgi:hypothetical protein
MATVTLGLLQHACSADPKANLKKTLALTEQAAKKGAKIICTQELFRSQYFCQAEDHKYFELAEPIPGPSTVAFQKIAKKYKVVIVASLFEKRASGLYHNTAVIIDADGSLLGIYRKMHIPDDPLFYEKFYFTPGDTGFRAWNTKYGKIGVLICWDQWYPEGARLTSLQGAEIFSIRPPSAGTLRKRPSTASTSTAHGKPSSAATPWRTAATSLRSTASASSSPSAEMAWSSGARASSPARAARSSPRRAWTRRRFSSSRSSSAKSTSPARTGRSSAIAASTPTAT